MASMKNAHAVQEVRRTGGVHACRLKLSVQFIANSFGQQPRSNRADTITITKRAHRPHLVGQESKRIAQRLGTSSSSCLEVQSRGVQRTDHGAATRATWPVSMGVGGGQNGSSPPSVGIYGLFSSKCLACEWEMSNWIRYGALSRLGHGNTDERSSATPPERRPMGRLRRDWVFRGTKHSSQVSPTVHDSLCARPEKVWDRQAQGSSVSSVSSVSRRPRRGKTNRCLLLVPRPANLVRHERMFAPGAG
jgi:hypothetical protein